MIGILVYEKEAAQFNMSYINQYLEEGMKIGLDITLCYYEEIRFGVKNNCKIVYYQGKLLEHIHFVINRTRESILSKQFERMGIPVFNSSMICEICNDKALTYQYLSNKGIRMIDSFFVRNQEIAEFLKSANEAMVIKSVAGHGGKQVYLYEPSEKSKVEEVDKIVAIMNGQDVVVQPYVKGKRQDLRVYIIGNEIVASVLRSAKDGFRANYSLGGEVSLYTLSTKEESIVRSIMKEFDFSYVGIDFLVDEEGKLIFNEVEDVVGARMLYQCSNINIVSRYLKYIKNRIVN